MNSIVDRTNPNLALILHFFGKVLWILLAAIFGYVGLRLYSIGITDAANVSGDLYGLKLNLENAGPGLIVMVMALATSVVGVVRSKLEITPCGIVAIAAPVEPPSGTEPPRTPDILENQWGLKEIAMLRIPHSLWASEEELQAIVSIQTTLPLPDDWPRQLSEIAWGSDGFLRLLRQIRFQALHGLVIVDNAVLQRLYDADFELPWCARLRWAANNTDRVDVFVYVTRGNRRVG